MPSAPDDLPALAAELTLAITRLRARLRVESDTWGGPVTFSQLLVLARIVEEGPMTASELAAVEHLRRQSVSTSIAGLLAAGLVASAPDPADGRKTLVRATDAGVAHVASISERREAWLAQALTALDARQRRTLHEAAALIEQLSASA